MYINIEDVKGIGLGLSKSKYPIGYYKGDEYYVQYVEIGGGQGIEFLQRPTGAKAARALNEAVRERRHKQIPQSSEGEASIDAVKRATEEGLYSIVEAAYWLGLKDYLPTWKRVVTPSLQLAYVPQWGICLPLEGVDILNMVEDKKGLITFSEGEITIRSTDLRYKLIEEPRSLSGWRLLNIDEWEMIPDIDLT